MPAAVAIQGMGIHPPGPDNPLRDQDPPGPDPPGPDPSHPTPVDRHTPANILPCPKLRLRAVNIYRLSSFCIYLHVGWIPYFAYRVEITSRKIIFPCIARKRVTKVKFFTVWLVSTCVVCETICDAVASLGLENFWLILPRIPPPPPSLPPQKWLVITWHFKFWVAKNTLPQWKFG